MPREPSEIVDRSQLVDPDIEGDCLSCQYFDHLYASQDRGDLLVSCEVIDGVLLMKHEDKYFYAGNGQGYWQVEFKADVPERHERLRLVPSAPNNKKFCIALWDQEEQKELFAYLEWIKCAYGSVSFSSSGGVVELQLSRIDS
ncbi:hypothetical protein BGZ83_000798 [Gryganskiella cystojenkinii]|nr:hypothetical protein BGZ83_000798 [Gryganskiella cystojenkinii]